MPLFSYTCQACGKSTEMLVRNAEAQPACPACGAEAMVKQMSAINPMGSSSRKMAGPPICDSSACAQCPGHSACSFS